MKKALCAIALAGMALGSAHAEQSLKDSAVAGQYADVASTATGLALGAAEANPLGLLVIPAKVLMYKHIESLPADEQPASWAAYGAYGWGAAANNLCVIAAIATGGASGAVCPIIGIGYGLWYWNQNKP